jgi:hypothetical protein
MIALDGSIRALRFETGCAGISVQSNRQRQWCHRQASHPRWPVLFSGSTYIRISLMLTPLLLRRASLGIDQKG